MTDPRTELADLDASNSKPTLGPVRLDAAAYATVVVTTVFAYLAWVANVVAPPEVVTGTVATVAGGVGLLFPNSA